MLRDAPTLVGRSEVLREIVRRIESDVPLLTLVGAPGVGKSALARTALRDAELDASVVCDVSGIRTAAGFLQALALSLRVETEGDLLEAISASLRRRRPVVLLDGFDHLVASAEETVGALADLAPEVLWVITSRQRLNLRGEALITVEPLSASAAAELFRLRAPAAGEGDGDLVQELVDKLDRNPLAIELAAARHPTFRPTDLLERLDRRFRLLRARGGASLEDAIALSWELLDEHERAALSQTTVFAGGFDLDAAESVIQLDEGAPWVLDVVESLVEKSLLLRGDDGRLSLSESIRAFVVANQTVEPPLQRHADFYIGAEPVDADTRNLLTVVERFEAKDPVRVVSAALRLNAMLRYGGLTELHQDVLARGIAAAERSGDARRLAVLLQASGELGVVTGQLEAAEKASLRSAEIAAGEGDWATAVRAQVQCAEVERRTGRARAGLGRLDALLVDEAVTWAPMARRFALAHQAGCLVEIGEIDRAREVLLSITPAPREADAGDEYQALKRLAYAHYYLGNYDQQQRLNEAALELARVAGDRRRVARAKQGLGDAAFARSDFDAARGHYEEALSEHRELGNEHLTGVLLGNLGAAEHRRDALDAAAERYHESLAMHQRAGARPYEAVVNFALGVLEHERGYLDDADFHYQRAVDLFSELGQDDDVLATGIARAWLQIARGQRDQAAEMLAVLHSDDAAWRAVVERSIALARGESIELAPVSGSGLAPTIARALGELLCEEPLSEAAQLHKTLQGRLVRGLAEADVPALRPAARPALVVGPGGEWFQTTGDRVNLRRRKAHRRFLDELTRRYAEQEGPLDVYDAFDLGWAGEVAEPEVAAERVYWVVGVLRRLGLDGILLTSDEGYYLDPTTRVERADA